MRVAVEGRKILAHWCKLLDRHLAPLSLDLPLSVQTLLTFEPRLRGRDRALPCDDGVDLFHIGVRYFPPQSASVVIYFARIAASCQRGADNRIRQRPVESQLRQRLAVALGDSFQFLDGAQILEEMIGAEQVLEQVDVAKLSTF